MPEETKINYQNTLNLPKTDFSMKAGLIKKEPGFLKKWKDEDLHAQLRKKAEGKEKFILHDGPPYANGDIHMGHALNKVLKDIIVKYQTMQGYDSLYVPGWDCHGLPIEHKLLKEKKQRKSDVNCVEFRKEAHDYAMKYVAIQRDQFIRLGIFGEWDDPYLTLDKSYEYSILTSLAALHEKGYIYRGLKPVNWCFDCETALAEAEVEYEDHTSPSVYVKFEVKNPQVIQGLPDRKLYLVIWTTTPWTLLANVAVAVHPSFRYAFVDNGNEILILESSLKDAVLEKAGRAQTSVIKEVDGDELTDLLYVHPFGLKEECRVVTADYVTKEDGTGLVHTAPGHGQDDYQTGLKYGLDVLMPVNDRGVYLPQAGAYAGQHVFKANTQIIEDLTAQGVLLASEDIAHSYPHCWRCKKPIIFRATKQWFMRIDHDQLRKRLMDSIRNDVRWIPEGGMERILGMVAQRPDWCLSRQRHWGVPIPALICEGCGGEHKLFPEVMGNLADKVKEHGTDIWFEKEAEEFLPKGFKCPDCGGTVFTKAKDILDVWFDSGVSHRAVIQERLKLETPVDLYLEGSDQHRGWFQSSLIPSVAIDGKAPFKSILTHGFVVDGQGRKMSKSMGNVISPLKIMDNSGADIIRLWVASSSYVEDIRISQEILDRLIDAYRKIRNTMRFLLGNLNGFVPEKHLLPYAEILPLDKFALSRLADLMSTVREHFNQYEFAKAFRTIYNFCNETLSSFYLDISKDRLYISSTYSQERRSAQTVLYYIINHLVRALAPILTFTAEEIYQAMPLSQSQDAPSSVHLCDWLDVPVEWSQVDIEQEFKPLEEIRPDVLKALEDKRRDGLIGSALEAKVLLKTGKKDLYRCLSDHKEILPSFFIVSQMDIVLIEQDGSDKDQTEIIIEKADGQKCPRCWNFKTDIGQDAEHPMLCARCSAIVKEAF